MKVTVKAVEMPLNSTMMGQEAQYAQTYKTRAGEKKRPRRHTPKWRLEQRKPGPVTLL